MGVQRLVHLQPVHGNVVDIVQERLRLVATLWLLFGVVVVLGWSILRRLRGEDAPLSPFAITGRVTLVLLGLGAWLGIMANQLPCVLGLPNCDCQAADPA